MKKWTSPLNFVSGNLVTRSNLVEFRDSQNLAFFKASGVW